MESAGGLEEQVVAGHRVVHAGAGQDEPVVAPERRDHDCSGHELQAGLSQDCLECGGADTVLWRAGDRARRQNVQVSDVGEHVQHGDDQDARSHRHGQVALRILELASGEPHVVPRVHREQRPDHGASDHPDADGHAPGGPEVGPEVGGQGFRVAADGEAEQDQQRERAGFDGGESRLDDRGGAHAAHVDPRQQGDREDGENALGREPDRDIADRVREVQGRPEEHVGREGRPEDGGEPCERDRDRGDGPGLDHHEQRPAVQVAEQRGDSLAQVDVLPAGAGEHGRQLAVGERAHERDDARYAPDHEQQARAADFPQDLRRNDEDPRADHRSDHEGGGVEPGDSFDELGLRFGGGHGSVT